MCTAVSFNRDSHYFGRNLDLEYCYNETVTITPRKFPLKFRCTSSLNTHYAIIGMATVAKEYPLYYDATNEFGLSMAGLNFPGNAYYADITSGKENIAPFELIPWILGQCQNLSQAVTLLKNTQLTDTPFSLEYPNTPLHWMVSDVTGSIVIEPLKDGLKIHSNPVGILTNNPPFDFHISNLHQYLNLTNEKPTNRMSDQIALEPFSNGMGAIGLPGDLSSASRFVRASFTKLNSIDDGSEIGAVNQFFHILRSVAQTQGCVRIGKAFEKTVYTSCCNANKGIYYYTTYNNSRIHGIRLFETDSTEEILKIFPFVWEEQFKYEN